MTEPLQAEELEAALFEFLRRKYVQSADERQRDLGLSYTTAETRDLAKEVAAFIDQLKAQATTSSPLGEPLYTPISVRSQSLAQATVPKGEAVAWMVQTSDGLGRFLKHEPDVSEYAIKAWREKGWTVTPLYAHPPSPEPDQLKDGELLPCPFCGGPASTIEDRGDNGCEPLLHRPQCKVCGGGLGGFNTRPEAIAIWNRRALSPRSLEGMEEIVRVIGDAYDEHWPQNPDPEFLAAAILQALYGKDKT